MKTLKFGGTSVSDATNISRVLDIVAAAAREDRVVVVCSAMSGVTDMLVRLADCCSASSDPAALSDAQSVSCPGYASAVSAASSDPATLSPGAAELIRSLSERHRAAAARLFSSDRLASVTDALDNHLSKLTALCLELSAANAASAADAASVAFSSAVAPSSASRQAASADTAALRASIEGTGELLSTTIIAAKLTDEAFPTTWLDSRELVIRDDMPLTYRKIREAVQQRPDTRIFVAPGFVASNSDGSACTLGRGGSDYSASIFAAALDASDLQIWTDVSGILSANPKQVPSARSIDEMSYEAAFAMASNGAKVLYAPAVAPAREAGIAIRILNTFRPSDPGTVILSRPEPQQCSWVGLADKSIDGQSLITLICEGPLDSETALRRSVSALRQAGIAPLDCSAGDSCIRLSVQPQLCSAALAAVHNEFFQRQDSRVLSLYIAGRGAVGRELERLIGSGLARRSGKSLVIKAISSDHGFVDNLLSHPDRGAVFVDCTDSEDIWRKYAALLDAGFNIVTSNRRSIAVPYVEYRAMKQAALRNGLFLRYETTVGASLPMLETIARSSSCGDRVSSIEAVVSCTLNYVLSSPLPFVDALEQAREAGLTEKDPQDDLGGKDALRKLLILAREAGVPLDAEDVEIEPVAPDSCPDKDMRFVASLVRDKSCASGYKARIALCKVGPEHPAHWLRGTDNAIIIRSLYHPTPLVILGPGEGAELAAGSILNDILL